MAKVIKKEDTKTIGMSKSPKAGETFRNGEKVNNPTVIVDVKAEKVESK